MNNYKIGDFIHYEFKETKDYSIVTKNYENKEGENVIVQLLRH